MHFCAFHHIYKFLHRYFSNVWVRDTKKCKRERNTCLRITYKNLLLNISYFFSDFDNVYSNLCRQTPTSWEKYTSTSWVLSVLYSEIPKCARRIPGMGHARNTKWTLLRVSKPNRISHTCRYACNEWTLHNPIYNIIPFSQEYTDIIFFFKIIHDISWGNIYKTLTFIKYMAILWLKKKL